jgi:hypothetical protein
LPVFLSGVGQNTFDALEVGAVYQITLSQATLAFGGFLGENVARERLISLDFPTSGQFEALCSTSVCLHFWHNKTPLLLDICYRGEDFISSYRHAIS